MKPVREKAEDWLKKNGMIYSTEAVSSLALLLREQDRDTRHACAEAVIQCEDVPDEDKIQCCHNVVMNTRAI